MSALQRGQVALDRLGGKDAITAVVKELLANVVADKRINAFFENAMPRSCRACLSIRFVKRPVVLASTKGKDMKTAHKGMKVTEADFNALVEDPREGARQVQGAEEGEGGAARCARRDEG